MAIYVGYSGNFKVGTQAVGRINNWSLDVNVDIVDISAFNDEWKKKSPTQKDWSGNCSGQLEIVDAGQALMVLGGEVTLRLYVDGTHYFTGPAIVESISRSAAVAGVLEVTFNFTGNGEVTYA